MKQLKIVKSVFMLLAMCAMCSGQNYQIVPHNKIALTPTPTITLSNNVFAYTFVLTNGASARQSVWNFRVFPIGNVNIESAHSPANWKVFIHAKGNGVKLNWTSNPKDTIEAYIAPIKPGRSLSGFSFSTSALPGIVTYYAEGDGPDPYFDEGQATDSIPGYTDLTPYGPGVVGETIGPVQSPDFSDMTAFLDTLISYKHQCVVLGWLTNGLDREKDEDDDKADEGMVERLDRRLDKAKDALANSDSVKARLELELFMKEVEQLYHNNKEEGKRKGVPVLTGEGYALLKFNAEYLIDRFPERHGKGNEGKEKEKK